MNQEETFLYTDHLKVGYDKKTLIDDIQFQLQKGKILTLIGPNGSGKSTILKSLTKYLKPIKGSVYIENKDVQKMSNQDFAQKTAIVFTNQLRTEMMTCQDVVDSGRYPYTGKMGILSVEDKKKVQEAMELVRVWDLRNKDYQMISDGQRQRVLLARAICQEPDLVVLDEPTTFLDIHYKLELVQILRMMSKEKHIAVIASMHELDIAQKLADYVLCVKKDHVVQYGLPNEVFQEHVIQDLYDLKAGAYNPVFGSLELSGTKEKPKVFVIAGGGTGIETYRRLQKEGISFVTGVLHQNDVDYQIALPLAAKVISEKAFERIGEDTFQQAVEQMKQCEHVINCLNQYGTMNQKNQELLRVAEQRGLRVE